MSQARESLIKHLQMCSKLHREAKKILDRGFKTSDDLREIQKDVAKKKSLTYWKLRDKVFILIERKNYLALKNKIEADITYPDDILEEMVRKYKITKDQLQKEFEKKREMGPRYTYDPVIKYSGKIFTFSEEENMMENLCTWKENSKCKCQLCASLHLRAIAYESAKEKAKCPKSWKKTADLSWVYHFEMRRTKSFLENFDSVKECKNFQAEVLLFFNEQHISGSNSSSPSSMQGNQSPSFNVSSMPNYEASTSRQQLPVSSQTSISHADMPGSSQQRIQEVSDVSSMPNYEASTSRQQLPVSSQTSISHADMPGSSQQRIQEVSDVSSMPNYEASTSRQQLPVSSQTSISHADMPGSSQQRIQEVSDVHIRKTIREHLNMYPQLHEAATAVLTNGEGIADRALKHNLDFWILERKVQILKRTNNYLKLKFPDAIKYYLQIANIHDINVQEKLIITAKKFDIGTEFKKHLEDEVPRFEYVNYIYKNITIPYEVFTSPQEEKILELLYQWKEANVHPCHCIICAMEHLLSMAYEFAKKENIQYPSIWNFNKADELWLLEFHMRNSEEMDLRFLPASKCTKEPMPPASTATCARESSSLLEISEQTTSFGHQSKRPKLSEDSNVPKSDEEKSEIIRERIKGHVKISDLLVKAAKEVLEENKAIGKVAHNHKLDLWILNKKVHIIKFRKTQFDIKRKHEDAVNAVKFNILSVSDAAKQYRVDKDFIDDKLKKLNNLYVHEELETDDTVLKWDDEFLLLNKLQCQVSNTDRECDCRSCVLLNKLPSLAYEFVKQKEIPYPSAWKATKKADVIWTCEFEMRHSVEISNYFSRDECKAEIFSAMYDNLI